MSVFSFMLLFATLNVSPGFSVEYPNAGLKFSQQRLVIFSMHMKRYGFTLRIQYGAFLGGMFKFHLHGSIVKTLNAFLLCCVF